MKKLKKGPTAKRYSESFKRQMVRDLERGVTTVREIQRRYGVTGGVTISGWLRKYGKGRVARGEKRKSVIESRKLLSLEREKRQLEQAVARLTVEKVATEALLEEAQEHFGVDFKKLLARGDRTQHIAACGMRADPDEFCRMPHFCSEQAGILSAWSTSTANSL